MLKDLLISWKKMDWVLNFSVAIILVLGSLTILSVNQELFLHQLPILFVSLSLVFIFALIDWRPLVNYHYVTLGLYAFCLLLLVFTFFFAPTIRGIRGWLVLGPVQLQVSELVKYSLIVIFSAFFARRHISIAHFSNVIASFFYFLIPASLILIQPDLGSTLVLFSLWVGYLLVSGLRWRHLGVGILVVVVFSAWAWGSFLKPYQKERIKGLFNPEYDPLGINYNVIQAKIAIGSSGFLGNGYKQGTQTQLGFLPEAANDFIFAAFIEEWGLLGGALLILAYGVMLYRIIRIGFFAKNNFFKFISLGSVILFTTHLILNVGSNLGLVPVVGVPLSFFSYGGSNLLTSALILGTVQSIPLRS